MDRTYLILEVLNFNKDALQILGDIIEEEGNAALAQKTRARKFDERKMLRLGLELIPTQICVRAATKFFQHALSLGQSHEPINAIFRVATQWSNEIRIQTQMVPPEIELKLSTVRQQLEKLNVRSAERDIIGRRPTLVEQVGIFLGRDVNFANVFSKCVNAYSEVLHFANDVIHFERDGNRQKVASRTNAASNVASTVASHCRDLPRIICFLRQNRSSGPWERLPYRAEQLNWQLEQLKVTIQASIESGNGLGDA